MKLKRAEIIWLVASIAVYLFFNIPGVPAYNDFTGSIVHHTIGFLLIWVVNYAGFHKICKIYRAHKDPDEAESENKK